MESNQRVAELLVESGAYKDLVEPVILTSGELGIYFINTEKLCQDGGEFKKYGDDSTAMIEHSIRMMKEHSTFKEVINILAGEVEMELNRFPHGYRLISGGQRRDWIFSGPVANVLGVPHLSLYKDGSSKVEGHSINSEDFYAVHVADLMTAGSSAYDPRNQPATGWIPMLKGQDISVNKMFNVVTRQQGGEEALSEAGVETESLVAIDDAFLGEHSTNPERALEYSSNPKAWSENYLRENGALALLKTFDPDGGKVDRANKFLKVYNNVLTETGALKELERAIEINYNQPFQK